MNFLLLSLAKASSSCSGIPSDGTSIKYKTKIGDYIDDDFSLYFASKYKTDFDMLVVLRPGDPVVIDFSKIIEWTTGDDSCLV